jgi:hypothetical protein
MKRGLIDTKIQCSVTNQDTGKPCNWFTLDSKSGPVQQPRDYSTEYSNVETRMLQRLQPQNQPLSSDIDRYFDSPQLEVTDTKCRNWLFNWWRVYRNEYPKMAIAARDYLAIPASEVSVERNFNSTRNLLGIQRFSKMSDTMRMLMLIGNVYDN